MQLMSSPQLHATKLQAHGCCPAAAHAVSRVNLTLLHIKFTIYNPATGLRETTVFMKRLHVSMDQLPSYSLLVSGLVIAN